MEKRPLGKCTAPLTQCSADLGVGWEVEGWRARTVVRVRSIHPRHCSSLLLPVGRAWGRGECRGRAVTCS